MAEHYISHYNNNYHYSGKQIYDQLDRLKNCKNPRSETWETIRYLLAYYLLTDDLVTTDKGKIYNFAKRAIGKSLSN